MFETPIIPETGQPLSNELFECVRAAESWDVVHRPSTPGTFTDRIDAARRALKALELDLASLRATSSPDSDSQSALLELRANVRLLRAAMRSVSDTPKVIGRLPRVLLSAQKDEPRVVAAASAYLRAVDGNFSALTFREFTLSLQAN